MSFLAKRLAFPDSFTAMCDHITKELKLVDRTSLGVESLVSGQSAFPTHVFFLAIWNGMVMGRVQAAKLQAKHFS